MTRVHQSDPGARRWNSCRSVKSCKCVGAPSKHCSAAVGSAGEMTGARFLVLSRRVWYLRAAGDVLGAHTCSVCMMGFFHDRSHQASCGFSPSLGSPQLWQNFSRVSVRRGQRLSALYSNSCYVHSSQILPEPKLCFQLRVDNLQTSRFLPQMAKKSNKSWQFRGLSQQMFDWNETNCYTLLRLIDYHCQLDLGWAFFF